MSAADVTAIRGKRLLVPTERFPTDGTHKREPVQ